MRRERRPINAPGVARRAALAILSALILAPGLAAADPIGPVTKLPLPRYASLKTDRVNLREGPSKDHATKWVYERAGLPVEITAEFEIWRKIRDSEGVEGWVLHSLLSGRRTALVTPNKKGENSKIYARPSEFGGLGRDAPVGGDRQHPQLRRRLVPGRWRRVQGIYRAGETMGRLPRRKSRMRRSATGTLKECGPPFCAPEAGLARQAARLPAPRGRRAAQVGACLRACATIWVTGEGGNGRSLVSRSAETSH